MNKIGIPSGRWDWLYGEDLRKDANFYPKYPNYGAYLDPPYTVEGVRVRGGPGWAVMCAKDFARLGLLFTTGGRWKGERLISRLPDTALRSAGANSILGIGAANGRDIYVSFGKVYTIFDDPDVDRIASWITGPVEASRHWA